MDDSNVFVIGNHQVKEKPPPRVCPRCSSDNTKFCFYNNYNVSQPRYKCKNCRRFWTHGGALRDIPIGGRARKMKRTSIDQASVSQVVSVTQQVNHHQPSLHAQETNEFLETLSGSSSVRNHFGSLPNTHGDRMPPIRSIPPMDRFDLFDGSFDQGYYGVRFTNLVPLMKQEDPNNRNQSFNNSMNMNHNASTSGSRGYPDTDHIIINNNNNNKCVSSSSYHLEKDDP